MAQTLEDMKRFVDREGRDIAQCPAVRCRTKQYDGCRHTADFSTRVGGDTLLPPCHHVGACIGAGEAHEPVRRRRVPEELRPFAIVHCQRNRTRIEARPEGIGRAPRCCQSCHLCVERDGRPGTALAGRDPRRDAPRRFTGSDQHECGQPRVTSCHEESLRNCRQSRPVRRDGGDGPRTRT